MKSSLQEHTERMAKRCELLTSYGFVINHEDSNVIVFVNDFTEVVVDFSAIAEEHFLSYALKKIHEHGEEAGRKRTQFEIKKVLGILF